MSMKYEKEFKSVIEGGIKTLKNNVENLTTKMSLDPIFTMDKEDLKIFAKCNSMLFDFSGYTKFNYALKAIDACEKYLAIDISDEEMQRAYINMLENIGNVKEAYICVKAWLNNGVTKNTAKAFLGNGISKYGEYMTTEEREKFDYLYNDVSCAY
ncbi:MAG: hypothetical protein Q4D26_07200 [Clostridia bacterium]|nr:hypothetical protein [Clostridia bacterium]